MDELIKSDNKSINAEFKCRVTTPSGIVHCNKDLGSPITLHGFLPHFVQYLHGSGQYESLIKNCPLEYKSNNAPEVKDVIGTTMLSILSGHNRYSHATSLYGDSVAAELLGLNKMVSHDSIERGLDKMDEKKAEQWLRDAYRRMYEPLLSTPYILDIDPTVKVLYGKQEKAEIGYNPQKPGRQSQCLHTYFIGSLRIVLDVEVHSGKETAGLYSHKRLWSFLDEIPSNLRPSLIRGDIGFGNEGTMLGCESRSQNFLFKLKQSVNIKKLISELETPGHNWVDAGEGWLGHESEIQLSTWTSKRRVVVLKRKHFKAPKNKELPIESNQMEFPLAVVVEEDDVVYEYQVLVTNTDHPIFALAQLYRDRGDCENNFDELKNHWGWGGFNSRNSKRAQIMMRLIGLVYNWWNVFCRLAEPERHIEAITSRRLFQNTVGRLTKTSGTRYFYVTAVGAEAERVLQQFTRISKFISGLFSTATQLTKEGRWAAILKEAFKSFGYDSSIKAHSDGCQNLLGL
jgi:hypothetical protein